MTGSLLRLTIAAALIAPPAAAERLPVAPGAAPDALAVRHLSGAPLPDPLPSPRSNHGAAVVGGKLFVFGGWDGGRWTDAAVTLDPATGLWTSLPPLPAPPMAVASAAQSGKIVVAGYPASPKSGWSNGTPMTTARLYPMALRLRDDRILVVGGSASDVTSLTSTEIHDPATRAWTRAAPMAQSRYDMPLVELPDGRILAAGGRQDTANSNHVDITACEIYDPRRDEWTPTGSMLRPQTNSAAFVRPDGKVLVAGGFDSGRNLATSQLYDPATGRWTMGPTMSTPRNAAAGAKLKDGRFLITGGNGDRTEQASAEAYDPATGLWTAVAPMRQARFAHTLTVLPDGRVMAAGGSATGGGTLTPEVYDPTSDAWTPAPGLRYAHSSGITAVMDGRLLIVGGSDASGRSQETEFFDPATGAWSPGPALSSGRVHFALAVMNNGDVMALGGGTGGYPAPAMSTVEVLSLRRAPSPEKNAFVFDPRSSRWSDAPAPAPPRLGFSLAATVRGTLALGGVTDAGREITDLQSLEEGRWNDAGRLPLPFRDAATAVMHGEVYVAGGASGPRGAAARRLAAFHAYDPRTGKWTVLPEMPTARAGAAAAALDGKIFVIGGAAEERGAALDAVEEYDTVSRTWSTKARAPRGVRGATASALGGRIYLVGGSPRVGAALATVQVYDPETDSWTLSEPPPAIVAAPPIYAPPPVYRAPAVQAPRFAAKSAERPHDFALVVGVGYYKSLPAADFAENDAREMAAALGALGVPEENVVVLTGAKATLSEVSKYAEEWLPRRVSKDSRVYFYFSGHGAPDVKDGSAYLMPWDGDAAFVKSTGFPLTRLYAALGDLPVARVVAMIDSCFSGAGGRSVLVAGVRPLVTVQLPKAASPRISVITASENEEVAGSMPERGHGLFSYYLLQGLSGAAAPEGAEHLTLDELYKYVRKHVVIDARRQNREQTPTLASPDPKLRLY